MKEMKCVKCNQSADWSTSFGPMGCCVCKKCFEGIVATEAQGNPIKALEIIFSTKEEK